MNELFDSGRINLSDERNNIFGCSPCPKCASIYRWPTQKIHSTKPSTIVCDCGFDEPITNDENYEQD